MARALHCVVPTATSVVPGHPQAFATCPSSPVRSVVEENDRFFYTAPYVTASAVQLLTDHVNGPLLRAWGAGGAGGRDHLVRASLLHIVDAHQCNYPEPTGLMLQRDWLRALLKLPAADGKLRLTDVASAQTLLRLVQSVPSPKAEPIKLWLAKVGYERMQEMADPALSMDRARQTWQQHGRSDKWIQQRMTGQETRNKLTDFWREHDIKEGQEFAILTNIIHQEWSGVSVKAHKEKKGLKSHNLRDHMSEADARTRSTRPS